MQWVQHGGPEVHRQREKWVVRQGGYDAATGKRRVKQLGTFTSKRAAVAHQRALLDGRIGSDTESLGDFLEQVWLPKKGRVEVSTFDQYAWAVRLHIVPMLGAIRLRDLSAEVVDEWLQTLTTADAAGAKRLGSTSTRLVRKILSMALDEAVQRGRLPRNPVALTQPPRRDRSRQKLGWTLDEARGFLAAASDHRLAAAFHLSLVTGLRRGEVLALRWQDVDLDRRVSVRQSREVAACSLRRSVFVPTESLREEARREVCCGVRRPDRCDDGRRRGHRRPRDHRAAPRRCHGRTHHARG